MFGWGGSLILVLGLISAVQVLSLTARIKDVTHTGSGSDEEIYIKRHLECVLGPLSGNPAFNMVITASIPGGEPRSCNFRGPNRENNLDNCNAELGPNGNGVIVDNFRRTPDGYSGEVSPDATGRFCCRNDNQQPNQKCLDFAPRTNEENTGTNQEDRDTNEDDAGTQGVSRPDCTATQSTSTQAPANSTVSVDPCIVSSPVVIVLMAVLFIIPICYICYDKCKNRRQSTLNFNQTDDDDGNQGCRSLVLSYWGRFQSQMRRFCGQSFCSQNGGDSEKGRVSEQPSNPSETFLSASSGPPQPQSQQPLKENKGQKTTSRPSSNQAALETNPSHCPAVACGPLPPPSQQSMEPLGKNEESVTKDQNEGGSIDDSVSQALIGEPDVCKQSENISEPAGNSDTESLDGGNCEEENFESSFGAHVATSVKGSGERRLNVESLATAYLLVKDLGISSKEIGEQLHVPYDRLAEISKDVNPSVALLETLREWLNKEPGPTWADLISALNDLDRKDLAEKVLNGLSERGIHLEPFSKVPTKSSPKQDSDEDDSLHNRQGIVNPASSPRAGDMKPFFISQGGDTEKHIQESLVVGAVCKDSYQSASVSEAPSRLSEKVSTTTPDKSTMAYSQQTLDDDCSSAMVLLTKSVKRSCSLVIAKESTFSQSALKRIGVAEERQSAQWVHNQTKLASQSGASLKPLPVQTLEKTSTSTEPSVDTTTAAEFSLISFQPDPAPSPDIFKLLTPSNNVHDVKQSSDVHDGELALPGQSSCPSKANSQCLTTSQSPVGPQQSRKSCLPQCFTTDQSPSSPRCSWKSFSISQCFTTSQSPVGPQCSWNSYLPQCFTINQSPVGPQCSWKSFLKCESPHTGQDHNHLKDDTLPTFRLATLAPSLIMLIHFIWVYYVVQVTVTDTFAHYFLQ